MPVYLVEKGLVALFFCTLCVIASTVWSDEVPRRVLLIQDAESEGSEFLAKSLRQHQLSVDVQPSDRLFNSRDDLIEDHDRDCQYDPTHQVMPLDDREGRSQRSHQREQIGDRELRPTGFHWELGHDVKRHSVSWTGCNSQLLAAIRTCSVHSKRLQADTVSTGWTRTSLTFQIPYDLFDDVDDAPPTHADTNPTYQGAVPVAKVFEQTYAIANRIGATACFHLRSCNQMFLNPS